MEKQISQETLDKLALALLDDDIGISEKAYNLLRPLISDEVTNKVVATEGRFYIQSRDHVVMQ